MFLEGEVTFPSLSGVVEGYRGGQSCFTGVTGQAQRGLREFIWGELEQISSSTTRRAEGHAGDIWLLLCSERKIERDIPEWVHFYLVSWDQVDMGQSTFQLCFVSCGSRAATR